MITRCNADFTLKHCFFGSVKITKNADPHKYKYSGCNIGFNLRSEFSLTDGCIGKNVIIFRADMISSGHIDNKGKGPTQGLDDTPLTVEAKY